MRDGFLSGASVVRSLPAVEKDRLVERLGDALAREKPVAFSYLFGSFVELDRFRDIDVAVYLDEELCPPANFLDEHLRLTGLLEKAAGLPVDVVVLNDAPLGLRMAAVRGRVLASRQEEARLAFVERTCLEHMDMEPLLRSGLKDLLG